MSVDQQTNAPEPTCDHCGAADETVEQCHLAPVGNLVTVEACAECRRQFGTVEPVDAVGETHGLTAPDGVCLVCQGDATYSFEQETPVAGQVGYIAGGLCEEHATAQAKTVLASDTDTAPDGGDR